MEERLCSELIEVEQCIKLVKVYYNNTIVLKCLAQCINQALLII